MKTKRFKISATILFFFLLSAFSSYAQNVRNEKSPMPYHQRNYMGIPSLTDDQMNQIKNLRTPFMKDMMGLKNKLAENQTHFRTLMTAEKADMDAINSNIDKGMAIKGELMKKEAAHRQDIRKLLNEEQRLAFDSQFGKQAMAGKQMMKMHRKQMKDKNFNAPRP